MRKRNTRFQRSMNVREYRKVFNIFMEGQKTEPLYFGILKQQCNVASILLHTSSTRTDPAQVLARAKKYIKKNSLGKNEEVWIVVDVDNREKAKFDSLYTWNDENKKHGLAISNPSFEYWLLLHFDSGDNVQSLSGCILKLKHYLPSYKKNNLGINQIGNELLENAINNARKKHQQSQDWHCDNHSTVYCLIEKILIEEKE